MKNYLDLMKKVVNEGVEKSGTLSLFGETLEFDLQEAFPIVTTREINYNAAFAELACFLRGETDVRRFNKMGVKFWGADCYKESWEKSPHKKHPHDLGKIYGYQWTKGFGFNQIKKLIDDIQTNPESRRHILTTFNPSQIDEGCLPPCYVSHQFYCDNGKLDMLVHQRSADLCIGVPFDLVSFATFQHLMALQTGMKVGKMKVIFGDVHIYEQHFSKVAQQIQREPSVKKPTLLFNTSHDHIDEFLPRDAYVYEYEPQEKIKYPFVVQPK